jgi:predicted methyltransferase
VTKGVIQRLKNVGFGKIDRVPQAFGLLAQK